MNNSGKIVITGSGAVCGSGLTVDAIWESVLDGRSAIKEISSWDTSRWPACLAAEVTGVDNRTLVEDRKLHKIITRSDLFGLYAAGAAIQNSSVLRHRETLDDAAAALFNDRCGVFAGAIARIADQSRKSSPRNFVVKRQALNLPDATLLRAGSRVTGSASVARRIT